MNTGKRSKQPGRRKQLEDDATAAAVRLSASVQTDPVNVSCSKGRQTEGSRHREESSTGDLQTGPARPANQGLSDGPSVSCDASKQEARCERCNDVPTLMVPERIVQTVYPIRYQGTVLYIPTGGFLPPHGLLHKMRSEE